MRTAGLGYAETPETFDLSLLALGHRFIGRSGAGLPFLFSSLLVDGKAYTRREDTGRAQSFEPATDGGGYLIVDGGQKFRSLGLSDAKRHVLVDFTSVPGATLIATLDQLRAKGAHRYTWQINVGDAADEDGLAIQRLPRSVGVGARVSAADGASLTALVVQPAGVAAIADDPVQMIVSAQDLDLLTVMILSRGEAPKFRVREDGGRRLVIDRVGVRYDPNRNRIVVEKVGEAPKVGDREGVHVEEDRRIEESWKVGEAGDAKRRLRDWPCFLSLLGAAPPPTASANAPAPQVGKKRPPVPVPVPCPARRLSHRCHLTPCLSTTIALRSSATRFKSVRYARMDRCRRRAGATPV